MAIATSFLPVPAGPAPDADRPNFAGLDVGNGSTKLVVDGRETRIPSYFQPIQGRFYDVPEFGYVEYVSGTREDLVGSRWLVGEEAYRRNPEGFLRVTDDKQGKPAHCLQLLLGALSYLQFQPSWNLHLVASVHLEKAMGQALAEKLVGSHTVRFSRGNPVKCDVRVLKTLEESAGVIASCPDAVSLDGQTLVYDFGNGTIAISLFGQRGKLVSREVRQGGVEALIEAISKNPEVVRTLYREGDRHVIRQSLEARTFQYQLDNRQLWNFYSVYEAELTPWVANTLKTALGFGSKWVPTSNSVVAIGGGVELPLVAELLKKQGITPVADPAWANARGLQRLAVLLGGKR